MNVSGAEKKGGGIIGPGEGFRWYGPDEALYIPVWLLVVLLLLLLVVVLLLLKKPEAGVGQCGGGGCIGGAPHVALVPDAAS
jgi:hypothetical protein